MAEERLSLTPLRSHMNRYPIRSDGFRPGICRYGTAADAVTDAAGILVGLHGWKAAVAGWHSALILGPLPAVTAACATV